MFKLKLNQLPLTTLDYDKLAHHSHQFSGADIDGVIEAVKEVLSEILASGEDRLIDEESLVKACKAHNASYIDWLKTAHNLVMFGRADKSYEEVKKYLNERR